MNNQQGKASPGSGAGLLAIGSMIAAVAAIAVSRKAAGATPTARCVLLYYSQHTADINARIDYIRPAILVTNTINGWWGFGIDRAKVTHFQSLGISVFCYIWGNYETDTKAPVSIQRAIEQDGVDGVFIDGCSAYPASFTYIRALADIAHSYGKYIYINTGINDFDPRYFTEGDVDLVNGTEHFNGSLSAVQKQYGSKCTVLSFPVNSLDAAYNLIADAYSQGIAYAYTNTDEYASIAPYWEELADLLRQPIIPGPNTSVLSARSEPSGAEIWVDYDFSGYAPLDLTILTGTHHVGFWMYGYNNDLALEGDFVFSSGETKVLTGNMVSGVIS